MFNYFREYSIKIWKDIINNYPLVIIIMFGFFIRWYGIYFDYPRVDFIWDEIYNIGYLFDVLQQKTLIVNPPSSTYPLVLPILLAPVFILRLIYIAIINHAHSVAALQNHILEYGIGEVYIIGRWYSVFFGTATIYLAYKVANFLFKNKYSSYYAALVYSASLIPVFISHWGKHHSTMVFFLVLSLFFALKFEKEKQMKYFYRSAIAAALSFSTHYVGISAFAFPLFSVLSNRKHVNIKTLIKSLALTLVLILVFYLTNYYGIKRMFSLMYEGYYSKNGLAISPLGTFERFYYVFRDYFYLDPVFLVLFFAVLVLYLKPIINNKYFRYILAGLVFNYFLLVTIMAGPGSSRWLLIFMTLSVPFFAGYLAEILIEKKIRKETITAVLLIIILPSAYLSYKWNSTLRSNTAIEAESWLLDNIKNNENVYSFYYTFYSPLSYQAAVWNLEKNDMSYRKIVYITEHQINFKNKGINLMYDKNNYRYGDLAGKDTKYIVISSPNSEESKKNLANLKKYHKIELVKSFYPAKFNDKNIFIENHDILNNPSNVLEIFYTDISGPPIEIYRIRN